MFVTIIGRAEISTVMPGLDPPARPKPLRRGEGPGIHVSPSIQNDVDGRDKPGHDEDNCEFAS
ncbi:hypothetical protein HL666_03155 [Bradyrhizobium sp. 83002]|uniref:hypothetical protein n=1 Tax=Bradyrhizobium aeschynomenes TaxID=2734909 RepID=UPI0015537F98|nr:hypothetical protein [Bradyrhizobium aeschynomenes]NPU09756.1 hypothetical protein [Bradyrhizobium aeschynomenes]